MIEASIRSKSYKISLDNPLNKNLQPLKLGNSSFCSLQSTPDVAVWSIGCSSKWRISFCEPAFEIRHWCQSLVTKSGLCFQIWASEVQFFLHPKSLRLAVFRCQKMGLWMPKSQNKDHFLSPTIPKNGGIDTCFTWISFSGEFWTNFENRAF